ncbi:MAG TPA: prolyl oligopeptidase family serine peptidase [Polyangiaceae bacterium]|nr:prolyl oligopeptidase family serine peptidase [Polyangiaceae bacterium]
MKAKAPYGTWRSFISASAVAESASRPGDLVVDGLDIYIGESRPEEAGRVAIVKLSAGGEPAEDVLPAPYSARSRVHEYGGGAFNVRAGSLVFVHDADQALYLRGPGERPRRLTPLLAGGQRRFAEPIFDGTRERILAVVEEHGGPGKEPENAVAAVGFGSRTGRYEVLLSGQHFYSSLRLSPDAKRLAWLSWRHPCMPWDGTELWVAELDSRGMPKVPRRIAGGPSESIVQPEWDAHGVLRFISDRSGYWNLYRWDSERGVEALCPRSSDFGAPQWVFGMSSYCPLPNGDVLCTLTEGGVWRLARLSPSTGELRMLDQPYTEYSTLRAAPDGAALLVASPTVSTSLMQFESATSALRPLRRYGSQGITNDGDDDAALAGRISQPSPVEYLSQDGMRAFGLFYPPLHPDYEAPESERPPLLVRCHGGPTSQASTGLNLRTQYWTSRGFAVLEVNYRGSSGYGRAYRDALRGQWGIGEVLDCIAGANALAERGLCDSERACISGGSAGGYTALAALTFHDAFAAGAIYYGVSDLSALARDTHKFESRYLDGLVGPYPEMAARYTERSPLAHLDRLKRPTLFFHGLQDKVTPPNQATTIAKALEEKGVPVAFLAFADEGHGFRHAETIRRTLDGEFYFYCRIFGIEPAEAPEKIEIKNLASHAR